MATVQHGNGFRRAQSNKCSIRKNSWNKKRILDEFAARIYWWVGRLWCRRVFRILMKHRRMTITCACEPANTARPSECSSATSCNTSPVTGIVAGIERNTMCGNAVAVPVFFVLNSPYRDRSYRSCGPQVHPELARVFRINALEFSIEVKIFDRLPEQSHL